MMKIAKTVGNYLCYHVFYYLFFFLVTQHSTWDLSSPTGITQHPPPRPPPLEAQSPNRWTAREIPLLCYFKPEGYRNLMTNFG